MPLLLNQSDCLQVLTRKIVSLPTVPCHGVIWSTPSSNTRSDYGTMQPDVNTLIDCLELCVNDILCQAVDFRWSSSATNDFNYYDDDVIPNYGCWIHRHNYWEFSTSDDGWTQYPVAERCPGIYHLS